ncbi:polyprenol-phosphate-mannose-dependent alpha-(1-2)-phosphatidylinositol pentamannoside mannosyltransferase [Longimycelium tulufanense]|uniref:Polyprenol-phosphate-mannose-dependent alpha-(1-2)-phosphatidylinositol pentamannoside mannosyltransferase n=1 Tax=Longimycelium tulufanense TaxID=907463 RepID=A0A8J3FZB4_9PSEU|nr:mannosyltransferase [Longimycelium tulufanense]GGM78822.1 polyprenol-phosphate-mannose-dependent alpha-(1-2)-phosphatidylinositol pentamannoside mannosyltransferase [Longimycelium tulufanense]
MKFSVTMIRPVLLAQLRAWAPWVLAVSLAAHLPLMVSPEMTSMIDLRVYREGAPALFGDLYGFRLPDPTGIFPLPFTYPPFAALLFLPLSVLPWTVLVSAWQAVSVLCLWWLVERSLALVSTTDAATRRRDALLWTAVALWLEPVRTTLNYGQVNLILAAVLLAGLARARPVLAGASVGLTAAVKLTPAISGLYFLVRRRWAEAVWSLLAFAAAVALTWVIAPAASARFWFHTMTDANRVGPVGSAINQSLRGALARTLGHDVGFGAPWLAAVAAAAVLGGMALWRTARTRDTLAIVLAVQLLGLLVSPISWSHHWVWVVPALVWLVHAASRGRRMAAVAALAWVAATGSYVISYLLTQQPSIWQIPRPWPLSALGWVYPACAVLTLVVLALPAAGRRPVEAAVEQEDAGQLTVR